MSHILDLFDESFVRDFFKKKLLKKYPDFIEIVDLKIHGVKKQIWEHSYHVVIRFDIALKNKAQEIIHLPIYCTAHSHEPRRNVFTCLRFLWEHGFAEADLAVPRALFYAKDYNAVFYRGIDGEHLYHYMKEGDASKIEALTVQVAAWLAKLHKTPTIEARNFNQANSRIKTLVPGSKMVLHRIEKVYPGLLEFYQKTYKYLSKAEVLFLKQAPQHWLVHGDAHPENFISFGHNKMAAIDLSDMCLADFARDLGSFLQQIDYMAIRRLDYTEAAAEKLKQVFLKAYWKFSKVTPDEGLLIRINNYYNLTALRTANYYLIKQHPEPERAMWLIEKIKISLNIY